MRVAGDDHTAHAGGLSDTRTKTDWPSVEALRTVSARGPQHSTSACTPEADHHEPSLG